MNDLRSMIKDIQRHVGSTPDGVFGPVTASLVMDALVPRKRTAAAPEVVDARSRVVIETLDLKAQSAFTHFLMLAKATAATLGCDYVLISGHRTWPEQDALFAKGRTKPGAKVTNARGGYSNHNFGIAADAGVFRAGDYLDGSTNKASRDLAAKVHKACSEHAKTCGLEWGGSWSGFKDLPHYEVATGLSMAAKRKAYQEKGSVL